MVRLNDIIDNLLSYNPKADVRPIEKAYVYSAKVHQGQVRLSGLPYLSHPLEVAYILTKMKMDVTTITSGLLHDTLEDTQATYEELVELFGREVAQIVEGVTKISKMKFATYEERQSENMKKIILATANDIRVIIVKLADRLHNMQTLGYHPPEKQKAIAWETLDIYAPIAGRLGIYWIKSLLEDLCLYYLEPKIYEKIKQDIAERKGYRERFIKDVISLLGKKLRGAGIDATIKGRHKNLYSIYRKMKEQNLSVNEVYDIIAFRVIVNTVKECYETLGLVHSMWPPIPGRIKDYISVPKENLYQSLHTTVIGPLGQRMEIQIRTWKMDRIAEEGIAAHWKYKEGKGKTTEQENEYFKWLRQLLEWQRDLKDPKEFLESVRLELFPNDVYVFTPKGEVKKLPKGSTPVDFAYSIHSEIGDRCIQAKVNNRLVPLDYRLRNGDIVEIITSPKQHPRRDWLDFVQSSRAKAKIRQWIRRQGKEESISIGKELIEKELEHAKIQMDNLLESDQLRQIAEGFSFSSAEDLLANVGWGKISPRQVIGRLRPKIQSERLAGGILNRVVSRFKKRQTHGIKIRGVDNVLIRFANCCNPIPGENVIGYITRGRGVTIHKKGCRHILDAEKERLVDVLWEPSDEDLYQVKLKVTSKDKKGILAEISSIISKKNANILEADIKTTPDRKGISVFTLEVENYRQLQDIMSSIKRLKDILIVERI
ncbi:MAG TPA: bifunctional (p)ppGpp synthetase/guanosine-3',5'-bis(diphosphate) 3'-pyrophosphohydrolase [Desulfobacteraceae bacterium]|nr:bifunctional (p)ppGpp synthetase/guanosine-3',5'-bis(diphosphate) 3'-pyrophosphohydrolase [Desulfobacteraceae bacterium]